MGKLGDKLRKLTGSAVFKGIAKAIPFGVGDLFGGVMDETAKSKAGTISTEELSPRVAKLVFYGGLVYGTLHCIMQVFE